MTKYAAAVAAAVQDEAFATGAEISRELGMGVWEGLEAEAKERLVELSDRHDVATLWLATAMAWEHGTGWVVTTF